MNERSLMLAALLIALPQCAGGNADAGYTCGDPDPLNIAPDGQPDPCHRRDAADAGLEVRCTAGEYVHWPIEWSEPTLLWFGLRKHALDCPFGSMTTDYEGHADLDAPGECNACTCKPPVGSCSLPTLMTASSKACGASGGTLTSFRAPPEWDGSCDDSVQLSSSAAVSLTVDSVKLDESSCGVGTLVPEQTNAPRWKTFARSCAAKKWGPGPTLRSVCIPDDEPIPEGFRLCVTHDGDVACPATTDNQFTEAHVFYDGYKDERRCSECSCGSPTGSVCSAPFAVYKGSDFACNCAAVKKATINSAGSTCIDIDSAGHTIASKAAGTPTYAPGVCQALGGESSGVAIPWGPSTFCCRP